MQTMDGLRQETSMTPEGREYRLQLIKDNRNTVHKSMLKRANLWNPMLITTLFKMRSAIWTASLRNSTICVNESKLLQDDALQHEEEPFILQVDQQVFGIKTRALAWLRDSDERLKNAKSSS